MAGFEGLVTPQPTEGAKSADGKKSSAETSSAPKSGPSLFDSMLAQVGGKATTEGETTEQSSSSLASKTQTTEGKKGESGVVNTDTKGTTTTSTDTKGKESTGSLFDKMVSQTKQQATPQAQANPQQSTTPGQNTAKSVNGTTKDGVTNVELSQTVSNKNNKNLSTSAKNNTSLGTTVVTTQSDGQTQSKDAKGVVKGENVNQKLTTQTTTTTTQNPQAQKTDIKTVGEKNTTTSTTPHSAVATTSNKVVDNKGEKSNKSTQVESKVTNNNSKPVSTVVNNNQESNLNPKSTETNNSVVKPQDTTSLKTQTTAENKEQVAKTSASVSTTKKIVNDTQELPQAQGKNAQTNGVQTKSLETTQDGLSTKVNTNGTNLKDQLSNNTQPNNTTQNTRQNTIQKTTENTGQNSVVENKTQTLDAKTQTNTTVVGAKNAQESEVKTTQTNTTSTKKESLADQLIASATATAKKSAAVSTDNSEATTTTKVAQNTTTTTLNNTNITKEDSVLSSSKVDTTVDKTAQNKQATSNDTLLNQQSVDSSKIDTTKVETKITEQNIVDKRLEDKSLDIKSAQKDQYLDKVEQNKVEKLASTATTLSASASTSGSNNITNEELANQLANIRDGAKGELATLNNNSSRNDLQNVNVKKDDLLNQGKKQDNPNNLLDKMVKESTESASKATQTDDGTLGTKDQFVQKDLPLFATAGYLHDQKRRNDIANMMKKYEGVKQAENAKGVSDIKKSAATLELNATETEVVKEAVQKEEARVQNTREGMLKRLAFDNHMDKKLHNNTQQIRSAEAVVTKATTLTNSTEEKVVEVAVSNEAVQTIENRIIGARQSLRTMMSDVARQMAQNYRPPLTAFRINLNPSGLGNIAVMIKSEQNNGINISLNMSNVSTHDTLVDNQAALRAALTRNFDNPNASFNLNFGMQQDNNGQSNQNQDGKSDQNSSSSQRAVSANNANQESTEEVIEQQASYM